MPKSYKRGNSDCKYDTQIWNQTEESTNESQEIEIGQLKDGKHESCCKRLKKDPEYEISSNEHSHHGGDFT